MIDNTEAALSALVEHIQDALDLHPKGQYTHEVVPGSTGPTLAVTDNHGHRFTIEVTHQPEGHR